MRKFMSYILSVFFMTLIGACGVPEEESSERAEQPAVAREYLAAGSANQDGIELQQKLQEVLTSPTEPSELRSGPAVQAAASHTCTAYTICEFRIKIICTVSGVRCDSAYVPQTSVFCEAWNAQGTRTEMHSQCDVSQ